MYDILEFIFVEQPAFSAQLKDVANDDCYRAFQIELAGDPEGWPVVKHTGGLRKARMRLPGRGKSGGARVLYLWFKERRTFCLYQLYTKGDVETVPAELLKAIRHEVQRIKQAFQAKA
jgi:hypothetical protein